MAFSVKLSRYQNQPWGFRMQGGKDFSTPLSVQKVQADSIADQVGLQSGDAILKINDINTDTLRHKEAQDVIMRAGNNLELTVQRGGIKTWKPTVTPLNQLRTLPKQDFSGEPPPVIKTSLAANKQDFRPIGSTHNVKAKPFNTYEINGSDRVTALVHKQYNSPAALYSMQNIAETLSAQAEVLTGGVKGDLQRTLDGEGTATTGLDTRYQAPSPRSPVIRPVEAPITYPSSATDGGGSKVNENLCYECGRLIVGVFVRIKDKNLHAECFKCNTCGSNLKNVGYYNINEKLYCDVHAKQVARQNPPGRNLSPVTVGPGAPLPKDVAFVPSAGSYGSSYGSSPYQGTPKSRPYSPTPRPVTAPSANVHKPHAGASKFVWPPPKSDDDTGVDSAPSPSAPSPGYRAPPSTQHTYYTPAALKTSPTATPPPRSYSPIPKPVSPTPYSTAPPSFKSVTAPMTPTTPQSPWSSSAVGSSFTGSKTTSFSGSSNTGLTRPAPKRGKGILKPSVAPGTRIPICAVCGTPIRGPFVTALGKTWCPDHFHCVNSSCRRPLQDIGFVEEQGQLYCELCYETYLAPICSKCNGRVKGDCLNAIGKHWHPECFVCTHCRIPFGNSHFYLEDAMPYCEKDWNDMFTTKCVHCGFPIEAGDRWVEALNSNYHSHCFKCSICNKNLEGQSFFAKGGRPFCKAHKR